MTTSKYTPKPIDFTDHVGHSDCPQCNREEDRVTIDVDGDTYARLAAAADANGESVDAVAERALAADDLPLLGKAMLAEQPDECDCWDCPNVRHLDPDGHLPGCPESNADARRLLLNLLAVIHGDGGHYSDEHGIAKAARDAEAKYLRVYVERDNAKTGLANALDALNSLLCAFPKLSREFSTAEQQRALRAAQRVLAEHGRDPQEAPKAVGR